MLVGTHEIKFELNLKKKKSKISLKISYLFWKTRNKDTINYVIMPKK